MEVHIDTCYNDIVEKHTSLTGNPVGLFLCLFLRCASNRTMRSVWLYLFGLRVFFQSWWGLWCAFKGWLLSLLAAGPFPGRLFLPFYSADHLPGLTVFTSFPSGFFHAMVAQRQCSGFVIRRLRVQIPSVAPIFQLGRR